MTATRASYSAARARYFGRRFTAPLRMVPRLLVVGAMKAGTTSLFEYLTAHPQIVGAIRKEVNFFDQRYHKGLGWYASHFPVRRLRPPHAIGIEASPSYLFNPLVPERVAQLTPDVSVVVALRDPIDRAYSHYRYMVKLGWEPLSFEEAIEAESERTRYGWERLEAGLDPDPLDRPAPSAWRRYSYVARGQYGEQLGRWFDAFGDGRIRVVNFSDLHNRPQAVYEAVLADLGLEPVVVPEFRRHNVGLEPSPIPEPLVESLSERFAQSNRRVLELTGIDISASGTHQRTTTTMESEWPSHGR